MTPGFTGVPMGPYAIACFESHRRAWRRIAEGQASHGVVLEDDLILQPDFAAVAVLVVAAGIGVTGDQIESWVVTGAFDLDGFAGDVNAELRAG